VGDGKPPAAPAKVLGKKGGKIMYWGKVGPNSRKTKGESQLWGNPKGKVWETPNCKGNKGGPGLSVPGMGG